MKTNFDEIIKNFKSAKLTFAGEDKEYFLTIKEDVVGDRLRLKYTLESGYDKVARVSLYHVINEEKGIKKWNSFGYKEVPDSMFEIDNFYVEPKFRNAGIGTAFFNIIMQNIVEFDKAQNHHSKLVFVRMDTPEATAFFNKWSAVENDRYIEEAQRTTRMIINEPRVVPAKTFTVTPITPELQ